VTGGLQWGTSLRRLADAAGFDALGADLHAAAGAVDNSVNDLQIGPENAGSDGGHVLADAALFLGLAAPEDPISGDRATLTNIATP
jgi:hypothetical protein